MSELSELMARDPLHYSDQDIATIVARLREQQAQFELGAKTAGAAPKKKAPPKNDILKGLGLNDLLGPDDILGDLGLK